MSSSFYPTINYDVFIPSDWTTTSQGLTQAQANLLYLQYPNAQTAQTEVLNNIQLNGTAVITGNPFYNSPASFLYTNKDLSGYSGGLYNVVIGGNNFKSATSASNNVILGLNTAYSITTGIGNIAIGKEASRAITTGQNNVSIGINSSQYMNPVSNNNVCIGYGAGATGSNGFNTFIGAGADGYSGITGSTCIGYNATSTSSNQVVLGTSAETIIVPNQISCNSTFPITTTNPNCVITNNTPTISSGTYNVGMGWGSFSTLTSGANNTCLGTNCLAVLKVGAGNTAIGNSSLSILQTGNPSGSYNNNTAIGINSGTNCGICSNNTFLGANTGLDNSANAWNNSTAVGYNSTILASNQVVLGTATETIVIPSGIISNLNTSGGNTLFGSKQSYNVGSYNTCLGVGALGSSGNTNNTSNTCVGYNAGPSLVATTSGQASGNSLFGRGAGLAISTGYNNVCIGISAGSTITTGNQNTCIGSSSNGGVSFSQSTCIGYNSTITANNQVVLGTSAETIIVPNRISCVSAVPMVLTNSNGNSIITSVIPVLSGTAPNGTNNTAFGNSCLSSITTGYQNTCFGAGACPTNATSFSNTAIGSGALGVLTTNATPGNNSQNTAIGAGSGNNFTNGANNTFLGYFTGIDTSTNTYNQSTCIGYNSTITASNQIVLGTSAESVVLPSRYILGKPIAITQSSTLSFPLSEIYYITPSTTASTPIVITLPTITTNNIGAKVCFRVVGINSVSGSNVSLATTGAVANIYDSITTATGVSTHTIYTTNTTAILSHTFYCLPTILNSNTNGWFQQGSV